jgi:hypothetical protein
MHKSSRDCAVNVPKMNYLQKTKEDETEAKNGTNSPKEKLPINTTNDARIKFARLGYHHRRK